VRKRRREGEKGRRKMRHSSNWREGGRGRKRIHLGKSRRSESPGTSANQGKSQHRLEILRGQDFFHKTARPGAKRI